MTDIKRDFPPLPVNQADREFLGRGFDSSVYKVDGYAYKVYDFLRNPDAVQRYADLMNNASQFLHDQPRRSEVRSYDDIYIVTTEINPTLIIDGESDTHPFAIAEYIPGPTLLDFGAGQLSPRQLKDISDQSELDFFAMLGKRDYLRMQIVDALRREQVDVTALVREEMGVAKLLPDEMNAKVRKGAEPNSIRFILTDLAAIIPEVEDYEK